MCSLLLTIRIFIGPEHPQTAVLASKYTAMFILTQDLLERNQNIVSVQPPQSTVDWDYTQRPTMEQIHIWEVVELVEDAVFIVAAHVPMVEYYAVVPTNPCLAPETFYLHRASERCASRARELGIELELSTTYTTLVHSSTEL